MAKRIAVYAMAKNEAAHVERFVQTTAGADLVVVTDTGSTDGTPDLLRAAGVTVHTSAIVPWRFDVATNCALAHVPADIDICVKLDLDEVLVTRSSKPWRDEIERLWVPGVQQIKYWYTWSWITPGVTPGVRFKTANIHDRRGFVWRHAGHAGLYNTVDGLTVDSEDLEIHHYMTSKSRPDYISLLKLAVNENRCPRTLFYLGREHAFRRQHSECIRVLQEYLAHPDAKWAAERANAMRHIGMAYEAMEQYDTALHWLLQASHEYPQARDVWFELLRFFYGRSDFFGGYWAGLKCLSFDTRDPQWTANTATAWGEEPYFLMARCAHAIGRGADAQKWLAKAEQLAPHRRDIREFALMCGD